MRLIVTQDRDGLCEIWTGNTKLLLNRNGMFKRHGLGSRVCRTDKRMCKKLFGFVPRPKTAKMAVIYPGCDKVEIKKQTTGGA